MTTSVKDKPGNVPAELTSFVGRRHEIAEARRLLATSRLVTLTGIGGVGKTRLAVRVAAESRRSFTDGVWFVVLGELHDSALLAETVAASLGLPDQPGRSVSDRLIDHLATRQTLLVLDNCEHLLGAVAEMAQRLLRSCPELRILATSRELLGVDGELVLRVPPLTVPDAVQTPPLEAMPQYEAVALFVARATAAMADFALTEANCAAVAGICGRVDGLPLAIELAVVRIRAMSVAQIMERLTDRYRLLTVGSRVAPTRLQTLRSCVDWSYELCTAREQQVWAWLSVFVGGFELDAAEGVCPEGLVADDFLDAVGSLVDKSILVREQVGEVVRFGMVETIRAYGRERLRESGDYLRAQRRHLAWYERLVLQAQSEWISARQIDWIDRLDRERPNLREALTFSLTESVVETDPDANAHIVNALWLFWSYRGLLAEARHWMGRALASSDDAQAVERPLTLYGDCVFAGMQGQLDDAAERAARCRALAEQRGDAESLEMANYASGYLAVFSGDLVAAVEPFQTALDSAYAAESHLAGTGLRIALVTGGLLGLAIATGLSGDQEAAAKCHEQILAITAPRGEFSFRAYSSWALAVTTLQAGETDRAATLLEQALRLLRQLKDPVMTGWCLESLAWIEIRGGEPMRAAVLMGAAETLAQTVGRFSVTLPYMLGNHDECVQLTRDALGDRAYGEASRTGAAMSLDESIAYALGDAHTDKPRTAPVASVLTPRESEVAGLVAAGHTNKVIASMLVISPRTAQGHVEHILAKLGFTSRTQIVAWIAENQLDRQA
ncbi:non-specific serine/threonine protein kinase [Rhodococcus sp. OK611]|uniref:ATP-binding protein n=1 Tax=unclassified Rhodococcus (in: high G+C Gram-positive bacteria) TaxID=192944 RepID=UPI000BD38A2E|nr:MULTISPECIES: LuxR C-terminal-related transcriptional regulator [unclassified Rhodococcus (in: high G+C Gram-positive bacteria)]PTR35814.1 non-specific serine/threonine protein kinase [Rhodococcus sp. OK611]SNX94158.1 non-specific serine/threonine protein kinase [Rhodococcus sp. OK270]